MFPLHVNHILQAIEMPVKYQQIIINDAPKHSEEHFQISAPLFSLTKTTPRRPWRATTVVVLRTSLLCPFHICQPPWVFVCPWGVLLGLVSNPAPTLHMCVCVCVNGKHQFYNGLTVCKMSPLTVMEFLHRIYNMIRLYFRYRCVNV